MIKQIKRFITISFASLLMLAPAGLVVPALGGIASADITQSLCSGTNVDSSSGAANTCGTNTDNNGTSAIESIGKNVIDAFSVLVGVVSVVMIIYGGFRYITSGGDSGKVGNAKNTLIYAIIGLIIVALAQVLVHYVIQAASNQGANFNH